MCATPCASSASEAYQPTGPRPGSTVSLRQPPGTCQAYASAPRAASNQATCAKPLPSSATEVYSPAPGIGAAAGDRNTGRELVVHADATADAPGSSSAQHAIAGRR